MKNEEHSKNRVQYLAIAVPRDHAPGHIYFVSCDVPDFPIKIGFTTDVRVRVMHLGRGLPFPIVKLASMAGTRRNERYILKHFRKSRMRGEWFRRTPGLMETIARVSRGETPFPPSPDVELARHLASIKRMDFSEVTGVKK